MDASEAIASELEKRETTEFAPLAAKSPLDHLRSAFLHGGLCSRIPFLSEEPQQAELTLASAPSETKQASRAEATAVRNISFSEANTRLVVAKTKRSASRFVRIYQGLELFFVALLLLFLTLYPIRCRRNPQASSLKEALTYSNVDPEPLFLLSHPNISKDVVGGEFWGFSISSKASTAKQG